jgi:hypothetical protein
VVFRVKAGETCGRLSINRGLYPCLIIEEDAFLQRCGGRKNVSARGAGPKITHEIKIHLILTSVFAPPGMSSCAASSLRKSPMLNTIRVAQLFRMEPPPGMLLPSLRRAREPEAGQAHKGNKKKPKVAGKLAR